VSAQDFVSIEDRALSREQRVWRWKVLISTYCGYAGFYLVRKVYPICKTTIAKEYGIELKDIAHIWSAFLFAYMLGQFINSFIGRKWGPRVLLLGGLGVSMAINIVFGFANSYWTFLAFMFFNGLVQAAGWPATVGSVAEWLRKKERGEVMGIWSTSYTVGDIVVKGLGGFLLAHFSAKLGGHYGVRYAFLGCTVLAFAAWWILFLWQRNRPEDVGLEPIVDHAHSNERAIDASSAERLTFVQYLKLALNPVVPIMGCCYFCIKFLRYALDSWLPTFLNLQGMDVGRAAYYSSIFNWAGVAGMIAAGFMLDRIFRGKWERLCLVMGIGIVASYITVMVLGGNPVALAVCYGLVGFMVYGPDSILVAAGAISVAGQRNAVAIAGLVNGIASIGPVVQEEVIGRIIDKENPVRSVSNCNHLFLGMSVAFIVLMLIVSWRVSIARNRLENQPAEKAATA